MDTANLANDGEKAEQYSNEYRYIDCSWPVASNALTEFIKKLNKVVDDPQSEDNHQISSARLNNLTQFIRHMCEDHCSRSTR
jgi:hypothetical protein